MVKISREGVIYWLAIERNEEVLQKKGTIGGLKISDILRAFKISDFRPARF